MRIIILNPHFGFNVFGNTIHNYFIKLIKKPSDILINDKNIIRTSKYIYLTIKHKTFIPINLFLQSIFLNIINFKKRYK